MPAPDPVTDSVAAADPNATMGDGPISTVTAVAPAGTQRYALGDEIARGGMGVIYRATDTALGREVAVKVLQERFALDSDTARRFTEEARISAQLQHPGIPPVHDLGTLPDGRPFLAMKLIKGQTLDELLTARPDVSAERGRYVAAFEAVCQAIAYAHSHSVIHRDLKPANVMVGAFGEVQVMDWGLAKVLSARPAEAADPEATRSDTLVRSLRDSDGLFTEAGSVLGTPAYMAPEQALGAVGKVDARSDVFGLGAILAVILTGRPPFAAGSAETVRMLSAQGRLEECFARLDGCGADPGLVALCRRCLAPSPADRPADAGEVARAVGQLRVAADERARRAELERVQAEGEKAAAQLQAAEQRKRRRVQLALAAAVGVLLLGGGAFLWWSGAQAQAVRARQGRNAEAVAGLLDQCEAALRGGDVARAAVALEAARKRAAEGGADESAARLEALAADLALLRDLDAVDRFRWTPVEGKLPDAAAVAARYREALGRYESDPDAPSPEAAAARVSDSAVRDRVVAAWDWLLRAQRTVGVRAALQAVDSDPYRDAVRGAVQADDSARIAELAGRPAALEQPPEFAAFLGENAAIGLERRRQLLGAAVGRRPGDLGLLMTLGETYRDTAEGWGRDGVRWFQAAVAAAPTNPAAHTNLGGALYHRRDPAGEEAEYREAIRLDPTNAFAHHYLGVVLGGKRDLAGAEAAFREAIRLNPKYVMAHGNLAWALQEQGDLGGAVDEYQKALSISPRFGQAHYGLGTVLRRRGDPAGAEAEYRETIRLDPINFFAHHDLGLVLGGKGDLAGAEAAFREAIRLNPKYVMAHDSLAWALEVQGDLGEAVDEYQKALSISPKDAYALSNLPRAERMRSLLRRLPDILEGKASPHTPDEACEFAGLCAQPVRRRYAAAVRLYEGAFTADPKLAADLKTAHRYNAACFAARAAGGEGIDAPADVAARTALQQKALGWLRADLDLRRKQAASPDAAERGAAAARLAHWLADSDLSGVRDPAPLAQLPAAERAEWEKLWADVKATLADAQKPPPPPGK
jgi:tetratricopeptide (TPR) repeat protein/tRNA A-37 threonylcarbamoyl transferase component Bud32